MTLKDIIKVQMLMCCQVLLIAKKRKKIKRNNIKRIIIKKYFQEKLNKPYTCNICGKSMANSSNQDMRKVKSVRVLNIKSNWIILI